MNLTSIDALALAQEARKRAQDQAIRMPFPSLGSSPSSLLADPNSIAAMAARRASMTAYPSDRGGIDGAACLALLDHQRRLLGPVKPDAAPLTADLSALAMEAAAVGPRAAAPPSRRRKPNFAEKLHAALSSPDCRDSACWLPSGRAFCITDQKKFVKTILPKYFREAKFESFNRRLKRWGFRKVYEAGLHQTVFAHDLFRRDRYDLCGVMNGRAPVSRVTIDKGKDHAALGLTPTDPGVLGLATNPGLLPQDHVRDAAMLRLAQQQMALRQMSQRGAVSPPGAGSSLTQAIINEAMAKARASDPPSRANSLSAMLAAMPPRRPSLLGAGGSLAQAMMDKSFAQASKYKTQVKPGDSNEILRAKAQLRRLTDDIANYNGQLAVLQQLRELQETRER